LADIQIGREDDEDETDDCEVSQKLPTAAAEGQTGIRFLIHHIHLFKRLDIMPACISLSHYLAANV